MNIPRIFTKWWEGKLFILLEWQVPAWFLLVHHTNEHRHKRSNKILRNYRPTNGKNCVGNCLQIHIAAFLQNYTFYNPQFAFLETETWSQSRVISCEIAGEWSDIGVYSLRVLQFLLVIHHCTIVLYSTVTARCTCTKVMSRRHFIIASAFDWRASFISALNLDGHSVRKYRFLLCWS